MEERQKEIIIEETEQRKWCVYIHICKDNNKAYIGVTQQNPERRWQNGCGYKNNQYFWRAIQKYGWHQGFEHIIFAENLTQERAEYMEIMLIALYDTTNPNYGYNMSIGGGFSHFGVKHSEETKKKISESRKEKYSGKNHPRFGQHCSEDSKRKMSQAKLRKHLNNDEILFDVSILQYDKNGILLNDFFSVTNAAQQTGISQIGRAHV